MELDGFGLHFNKPVSMRLIPAKANEGIKFVRTDIPGNNIIKMDFRNVHNTQFNTTIANETGASISTIEHLTAAIYVMEIDNLIIEMNECEVPLMDGGSETFVSALRSAGIITQEAKKPIIALTQTLEVRDESNPEIYIKASPLEKFEVEFTVDFKNPKIGRQSYSYVKNSQNFTTELAFAKTFGHIRDIEFLRTKGYALGGDFESAVIFDDEKILNPNTLTTHQDFVRHKILDFIGDIALSNYEFLAHFECYKSGHALNNALLYKIFQNNKNYIII